MKTFLMIMIIICGIAAVIAIFFNKIEFAILLMVYAAVFKLDYIVNILKDRENE
jgi:hypothetical protein